MARCTLISQLCNEERGQHYLRFHLYLPSCLRFRVRLGLYLRVHHRDYTLGFHIEAAHFPADFLIFPPVVFFLLKHLSTLHRFHPLHPCSRRFAAAVFSVARSLYRATDPPVRDLSSALRNPRLEAEQFMESDKLAKVKMIRLGHIFRPGSVIRLKGEIRVGLATSNDASFVPCVHWFG